MDLKEGGQVSRVKGIPPHIENAALCSKLLTLCNKILVEVRELTKSVRDAVSQVYEEMALENRMLTGERLKQMFEALLKIATSLRVKMCFWIAQLRKLAKRQPRKRLTDCTHMKVDCGMFRKALIFRQM